MWILNYFELNSGRNGLIIKWYFRAMRMFLTPMYTSKTEWGWFWTMFPTSTQLKRLYCIHYANKKKYKLSLKEIYTVYTKSSSSHEVWIRSLPPPPLNRWRVNFTVFITQWKPFKVSRGVREEGRFHFTQEFRNKRSLDSSAWLRINKLLNLRSTQNISGPSSLK